MRLVLRVTRLQNASLALLAAWAGANRSRTAVKTAKTALGLASVLRWSPGSLEERVKLVKPPLAQLQPIALLERTATRRRAVHGPTVEFVLPVPRAAETEAPRRAVQRYRPKLAKAANKALQKRRDRRSAATKA